MLVKALFVRSGFAVFRYRDYRFFWLAAAFANIGMWSLTSGRLWLMHELTHSPLMVGLVTTSSLSPLMFFSLWGGVVADRVNRLKLIRSTRAMFSALALLTGCLIAAEVIQPWHLIGISCATGTLLAFDGPARSAMVPALVPPGHLASAISLYSIVSGAAAIIGPGLFAAMIKVWGIEGVFFLIGAAYALNVLTLFCMSPCGHQPESRPQSAVQGLIEGVQYIRVHRVLGSVILLAAVASMFGSCYQTLLPIFSDQILAGGVAMYSKLLLVAGIAGLLASVMMTMLSPHMNPDQVVVWAGLGWGLGLLTLSTVAWLPGVVVLVGIISASRVVFTTMNTTLSQSFAADALRGRVMSVREFAWGTSAFGGLLMGAVAEAFNVSVAYGLGGGMVALTTLTLGGWMLRRRADAQRQALLHMEPTRSCTVTIGREAAQPLVHKRENRRADGDQY